MTQDFKEQFDQQVSFLRSSARAYDDGEEPEAKRLGVSLRVLLHDTHRSTSLLTHLGVKDQLPFVDTADPEPPPGVIMVFKGGLCTAEKTFGESAPTKVVPVLDKDQFRNSQPMDLTRFRGHLTAGEQSAPGRSQSATNTTDLPARVPS